MAKPPKVYPPEFQRKIVELVRSGESGNTVARRFNVSRQTITNWMKQDGLNSGRRTDGLTTDERAGLTMLRRENKRLKIEQEILGVTPPILDTEGRIELRRDPANRPG